MLCGQLWTSCQPCMLFQVVTVEQRCNNMLTILFIVGRTTLFTPVDINLEQVLRVYNRFYLCDNCDITRSRRKPTTFGRALTDSFRTRVRSENQTHELRSARHLLWPLYATDAPPNYLIANHGYTVFISIPVFGILLIDTYLAFWENS